MMLQERRFAYGQNYVDDPDTPADWPCRFPRQLGCPSCVAFPNAEDVEVFGFVDAFDAKVKALLQNNEAVGFFSEAVAKQAWLEVLLERLETADSITLATHWMIAEKLGWIPEN